MSNPLQIGILVFPNVTQLDFTGPLQVFSSLPNSTVHLIWKRIEPVTSDTVLTIMPTVSFADCPQLDVICVPGGAGTDDMVNDQEMLHFLRANQGRKVRHFGVYGITGSWRGRPAQGIQGDHALDGDGIPWAYGALPTKTRVCVDRNRVTGGGVTAGIDFALTLVSVMVDRQTAELSSSGSNIIRHRRSRRARPTPHRRKYSRA